MLQTSCLELFDCLAQNPSEYPTHLRRLGHVIKNVQALLHVLRQREAKAVVVHQLRDQVSRKRAFLEEARASLPNLRQRLEDISKSCSSTDAKQSDEKLKAGVREQKDELAPDMFAILITLTGTARDDRLTSTRKCPTPFKKQTFPPSPREALCEPLDDSKLSPNFLVASLPLDHIGRVARPKTILVVVS